MEMITLRLWFCSACGIVRAIEDSPHHERFPPTCDMHKEHWPNGDFETSVTMIKSDFTVEVSRI